MFVSSPPLFFVVVPPLQPSKGGGGSDHIKYISTENHPSPWHAELYNFVVIKKKFVCNDGSVVENYIYSLFTNTMIEDYLWEERSGAIKKKMFVSFVPIFPTNCFTLLLAEGLHFFMIEICIDWYFVSLSQRPPHSYVHVND